MVASVVLSALLGSALAAPPETAAESGPNCIAPEGTRHVLLIAGKKDSHPAGAHEYEALVRTLADDLRDSNVGEKLWIETAVEWPEDPQRLTQVDAVFLYSAG
ncbi:MAG: hypothetical protein AAF907_08330, partial [Planctomycetota bacterium]